MVNGDDKSDCAENSAVEKASMQRRACLVHVGSVDVLESSSVEQLHDVVHRLTLFQKTYLEEQQGAIVTGNIHVIFFIFFVLFHLYYFCAYSLYFVFYLFSLIYIYTVCGIRSRL